MKSSLLASIALAFAMLGAAHAQGKQDFELVNKTGYDLSQLFVSPAKSENWEEDVLGDDELEDGDSMNVRFSGSGKSCKWDIKVVYSDDDSSAVWHDIDLCEVSKVTLRYNRKTDTTTASFD